MAALSTLQSTDLSDLLSRSVVVIVCLPEQREALTEQTADERPVSITIEHAVSDPYRGEAICGTVTDSDGSEHRWVKAGNRVIYDGDLFGARPESEADLSLHRYLYGHERGTELWTRALEQVTGVRNG
jgi:hypothetical protein